MTKRLIGTVVSTKMKDTIVVAVERKYRHPLFRKVVKVTKRFKAHNTMEGIKEGDVVEFAETRPISKNKQFIVIKKIESKEA
ncbi:30S ribosomal protein S17 [Candidatus Woesebacteria bacterium]|nr:30S ribosomal protein S17 [Candidatus Woesebacteria bacterium]